MDERDVLVQKISDLEATIDRLHSRFEKNQRDHESEMKATSALLDTLKYSATTTKLLHERALQDLNLVKEDIKKNEDKANQRKNELVEATKLASSTEKLDQ
jgi:flagellar motility protein MotE (MotC chaperone)